MKKQLIDIGSIMLHHKGTNPYTFSRDIGCSGDERVRLLRLFKDGLLPENWAVWSDGSWGSDKGPITDPSLIDWSYYFE